MDTPQAERLGRAIVAMRPLQIGALPLAYPILDELQVQQTVSTLVSSQADVDLGLVVVMLTLNRLLAPQPLYHVQDWLVGTILPEFLGVAPRQAYDNRLGRALDHLHPHLGEIWARVATRCIERYDIDLDILHWDITSVCFEGAYADSELATYGYSRDHRPDTKQANLQVDATHDGQIPVLYEVLRGNTADITRPLPHLRAILRFFARPELARRHLRPLLVSDRKLVTPEAVLACHRDNLQYLAPLSDGTATRALLSSVPADELAQHVLAYRPQRIKPDDTRFVPYQGVWRSYTFVHKEKQVTDRALVVWSAGKQRLDEQKRKTYLKRLLNALEHIQKKLNRLRYKRRAYVEQRLASLQVSAPAKELVDWQLTGEEGALRLTFRINKERLAEARALDGRYALATNADHLHAGEALALYKGQDGLEKRFAVVKGPLLVHPLFVHSDRRIEGLIFISLLALLVRAVLERACHQQGIKVTAQRLLEGFAALQAVDLTWADGSLQRRAAEMTEFQATVLKALARPGPETYTRLTPIVR